MSTVREVDSRLQETLMEGRKLLVKLRKRQAELTLLRQAIPLEKLAERDELLHLCDMTTEYMTRLSAEIKQADIVARKIEGHMMWKEAVRSIWGQAGLDQCYAHMTEAENARNAQRAEALKP